MNAVRKAVGIEKKQTVTDQILDESCPKLSYNQRLTGYVLCMSIGFLLTIGSLVRLKALLHGDPAPFVIYFTFGNLCAIASCFFLSGPKSHCKKMVDRTRRIATAFYLITIFFTFFVVFYDKIPDDGRVGIIILCVFVQWIAMLWYTISFIPFARVRGVPRRLHAIDATRLQERRSWMVSLLILRLFGPSRESGVATVSRRRRQAQGLLRHLFGTVARGHRDVARPEEEPRQRAGESSGSLLWPLDSRPVHA